MRRHRLAIPILSAALMLSSVAALPSGAAPEQLPDRGAGLSEPVSLGSLDVAELADVAPSRKVVDGDPGDWIGTSAQIAGESHYDAGELVHTDFLWDAHGADAGEDIDRWNLFAGNLYAETRTQRLDDLARTLEGQLGVPYPIGADEMYGNANRDLSVGDLVGLRVAADDQSVYVLVRTATMVNPDDLAVILLADTREGGSPADASLGLPEDHRFDVVMPVGTSITGTGMGVTGVAADVQVAADATGWTNTLEIAVPAQLVAPDGTLDLSVMTAGINADGTLTPHNIAFRDDEPIDIYNDRLQAFALHGGAPDGSHIDQFSSGPILLDDLRRGRTQRAVPGPGYHERHFTSGDKISTERGRDGQWQPYGLYIPADFDPAVVTPMTFWLHYRGGKAHSGATINPRLIRELAREDLWGPASVGPLDGGQGNIVVTPHARGTSYWYVARAHQDFFEVFGDVHELLPNIDAQRRYLAGYSMGGYGTYLLGLLYPDLFAAGYSTSGAVTQGAWTGVKDSPLCEFQEPISGDDASACYIEANSGDASAQLTHRILDNARHYPLHIDHGTNDELVPVTGVQLMATRLAELGYRVQMQTFFGYEHFTQAATDEWYDGAAYLQRFTAPVNPRQVTYRVVPALVNAVNTIRWDGEPFDFNPDGAYWVDDIVVRDADVEDPTTTGLVDVIATGIEEDLAVPVPVTGAASIGHSTPFTRYGLDWLTAPGVPAGASGSGFEATLTGVASVSLDAPRMAIDLTQAPLCATITTDGPTSLTITGLGDGQFNLVSPVVAGSGNLRFGFFDGDLTVDLDRAGEWRLAAHTGGSATCPGASLP